MNFLTAFSNWCPGAGFWQAGGHPGWSSWMPFHFGGIFQLLIIGLIIYFTVRLLRKPATDTGTGTPEEILKRRFAAGEIDEQTYRAMKDEIHKR
ncbi:MULTISPECIES: SHOCT domain-containing protein [unclassified Pseudodesulfovibrio]|uniref:SHOCT domain-containing protein n=1 Tax=unclassified Pseudodesulfovibrio TaxID=2661612 RepID=UPI000FEC1AE3|nr:MULTISPECIES: SHOCT domain-containing protein [unclassified Pseudodesulfovibrio]MCJ2164919.1 SHOCT domain-containing protein [Pseudodesulfovibrio sp. S3-i]RWU03718.1 hypothetical protein DWB63_09660 [Pseudodesulfovibrio sp. S3]